MAVAIGRLNLHFFYILLARLFDWTITAGISVKKCEVGRSVKGTVERGVGREMYIFVTFSRGQH